VFLSGCSGQPDHPLEHWDFFFLSLNLGEAQRSPLPLSAGICLPPRKSSSLLFSIEPSRKDQLSAGSLMCMSLLPSRPGTSEISFPFFAPARSPIVIMPPCETPPAFSGYWRESPSVSGLNKLLCRKRHSGPSLMVSHSRGPVDVFSFAVFPRGSRAQYSLFFFSQAGVEAASGGRFPIGPSPVRTFFLCCLNHLFKPRPSKCELQAHSLSVCVAPLAGRRRSFYRHGFSAPSPEVQISPKGKFLADLG